MTAKAVALPARYGMRELRGLYHRYASIGLNSAIILHFLAIGAYYLTAYLSHENEPVVVVRIKTISDLGPPPSIANSEAVPPVAVSVAATNVRVGSRSRCPIRG